MTTEVRPWAELEEIYMARITEIEVTRDRLLEISKSYHATLIEQQAEIRRLQSRVKELEALASESTPS